MNIRYHSRYHPVLITEDFLENYHKETGLEYDASEDDRYFEITCLDYFNLPDVGEVGIYIFGKETEPPHFHLIGVKFETAIGIFEPRYFHENSDKLNKFQIAELNFVLTNKINSYKDTIWKCLVFNWNDFYDTNYEYNIPDYTQLD